MAVGCDTSWACGPEQQEVVAPVGFGFQQRTWPLLSKTSDADGLGSAGKCPNLQGKKEFMVFMT